MSLAEFENKNKLFTLALESHKIPAADSNVALLRHLKDSYLRATISACLNHQRAYKQDKNFPEFLKMAVLPTMVHSLASLPLDIFSLQAWDSAPCDGTYFFKEAGKVESISKMFTPIGSRPNLQMSDLSHIHSEEIIERLMDIACSLTQDMVQHGINKIVHECPQVEMTLGLTEKEVLDDLLLVNEDIREEIGRSANFIIMSTEMARALAESMRTYYDFDSLPINLRSVGVLKNRWKVFISAGFPNLMIMGYRGYHPVDAGIVVQPCNLLHKPKKVNMQRGDQIGYAFNWEGALTLPRKDYFRVIKLKLSKNDLDMDDL